MAAVIVRPGTPLIPKYLYYNLGRFKQQKLVNLMTGTANTSLTLEKLRTVRIEAPSECTQRDIVEAIDRTLEDIAVVRDWTKSTSELCDGVISDVLHSAFSISATKKTD